eukprot:scaffold3359_cov123-Cylindrotheca_fusiformis.AAC.8
MNEGVNASGMKAVFWCFVIERFMGAGREQGLTLSMRKSFGRSTNHDLRITASTSHRERFFLVYCSQG